MQTNFVTGRGGGRAEASLHMVPARLDLQTQTLKPLPDAHTSTHTPMRRLSCAVLLFRRQEECYRLTQRKSACRPVLTQGPSSLWPGQCPTVSLEAAGSQLRKRLSDCSIFFLIFLFLPLYYNFFPPPRCVSCCHGSFIIVLFSFT